MNLVTVAIEVKRGLNVLNVRRDSSLLCVESVIVDRGQFDSGQFIGPHIMRAYFACPTGRNGDEIIRLCIEDTGTMVSYEADVEYVNSFRQGNRVYHAFILRDRPPIS